MSRDELLGQIHKTEKYIERMDITDAQRESAEERYCNLVALIGTLPDESEAPEQQQASTVPEGVQAHIESIWRTLDPDGKRRKRA